MPHYHVTSARNRASIERFGLDWTRMGAARGIAGSKRPEVDGIFLCRERHDVDWFTTFDNGCAPFDVWAVDGVDDASLRDNGSGYFYLAARIPRSALTLVERDVEPPELQPDGDGGAYSSTLVVTFDDGRVLSGDEARTWPGGTEL